MSEYEDARSMEEAGDEDPQGTMIEFNETDRDSGLSRRIRYPICVATLITVEMYVFLYIRVTWPILPADVAILSPTSHRLSLSLFL